MTKKKTMYGPNLWKVIPNAKLGSGNALAKWQVDLYITWMNLVAFLAPSKRCCSGWLSMVGLATFGKL